MATKTVKWSTSQPLPCSDCLPANAVLCVKSERLDQSPFVDLDVTRTTVNAQVTEYTKSGSTCPVYKYTFEYEDSQLADLETPLACADIFGAFCKGCLAGWVEEKIAVAVGAVSIPTPDPTTPTPPITIVNSYGTSSELTAFPITATATITNPSPDLPMRVMGNAHFFGRFALIASATGRSITEEMLVDAVSVSGPSTIGLIPSATSSAMNSNFEWSDDFGFITDSDASLTLLAPGESKTYDVTFDGTMVGGDTISAINCQLTLVGINYTPA